MPIRTLGPKGGWICASEEVVPRRGVDTRRCASTDTRPKGGWIWQGSHIDWRRERVLARTLGPRSLDSESRVLTTTP